MDFKSAKAKLKGLFLSHGYTKEAKMVDMITDQRGLLDIIYIAVYLGIAVAAGAIILYITDEVTTITGTPTQANLSAAQTSLLGTAQTGYSFLPIVAVAAIGSIAIGYVFGLIPGMGKGRGGAPGGGGI